jgi:hypothetical protein
LHQRAGKPSELVQDLKKPAQNAPLTRSPRGNDGDDGDGADSSAWVENKKQHGGVSSEATRGSTSEALQTTTYRDVLEVRPGQMETTISPAIDIFTVNDFSD